MWEYMVSDVGTGNVFYILGLDVIDACFRAGVDIEEIDVLNEEYLGEISDDMYDPEFN
jgi:hypothetical protein